MKVIQTKSYIKLAYTSYDDQPGFVNRDDKDQGSTLFFDPNPESEDNIKKKWTKKRKFRPQILEEMPKGSI